MMKKLLLGAVAATVMIGGSFALPQAASAAPHYWYHVPFCVAHPWAYACRPHHVWHRVYWPAYQPWVWYGHPHYHRW